MVLAIALSFSLVKGELACSELHRCCVFCHTLRRPDPKSHLQRAGLENPLVNLRHRTSTIIGWLSLIFFSFGHPNSTPLYSVKCFCMCKFCSFLFGPWFLLLRRVVSFFQNYLVACTGVRSIELIDLGMLSSSVSAGV